MQIDSSYKFKQPEDTKKILSLDYVGITGVVKDEDFIRTVNHLSMIDYIIEGNAKIYFGNSPEFFEVSAGDTIIVPEGDIVRYSCDRSRGWSRIWLNVSGPFFIELMRLYKIRDTIIFKDYNCFEQMIQIYEHAKNSDENSFDKCISLILKIIQGAYKVSHSEKTAPDPRSVTMKNEIINALDSKADNWDIARKVNLSAAHAAKIFKNDYGISPCQYLLDQRIEAAKSDLSNSDLSVKEIAFKYAFSNPYYFSYVFKKKTGLSPKQYREA